MRACPRLRSFELVGASDVFTGAGWGGGGGEGGEDGEAAAAFAPFLVPSLARLCVARCGAFKARSSIALVPVRPRRRDARPFLEDLLLIPSHLSAHHLSVSSIPTHLDPFQLHHLTPFNSSTPTFVASYGPSTLIRRSVR